MRPSMLTARTTATVIGVLFLAADAAGAAGRLLAGRLVSAPVDVAALPDAAITPYVDIVFSLGALMLSGLLLRSHLVPGWLAVWGLAGGALYLAQGAAAAFGAGWGPLMIPLGLQEIALAIWLIVKGFTETIAADAGRDPEPHLSR